MNVVVVDSMQFEDQVRGPVALFTFDLHGSIYTLSLAITRVLYYLLQYMISDPDLGIKFVYRV